jgi:hypothetical protein
MKAKELKQLLQKKIKEIRNSKRFQEFIDFCSRFNNYSYYNLLSIYFHYPHATLVAGIKTWWNRYGRRIKKGEKGIPILAPIIKRIEELNPETGETIRTEKLVGFRTVYVWDVSQTYGKELPIERIAKPLEGKAEQYSIAKNWVSTYYCPVLEKPLGEIKGYTDFRTIVINSNLDEAHKLKTLFHELSHYLLHSSVDYSKTRKEFEAELTAYLVCRKLGIDSSSYSLDYLAIYSELKNEEFEKAVDKSIKAADHIFSTLTSKQFKTA